MRPWAVSCSPWPRIDRSLRPGPNPGVEHTYGGPRGRRIYKRNAAQHRAGAACGYGLICALLCGCCDPVRQSLRRDRVRSLAPRDPARLGPGVQLRKEIRNVCLFLQLQPLRGKDIPCAAGLPAH